MKDLNFSPPSFRPAFINSIINFSFYPFARVRLCLFAPSQFPPLKFFVFRSNL